MQLSVCIVLAVLLHISSAAVVTTKPRPPNKIEQTILNAIEDFRDKMDIGVPEIGIPSLNPLVVPDTDLAPVKIGNLGSLTVAKIEKTTVDGLQNFNVDHLRVNIISLTVILNMSFPLIHMKGKYALDGKIMSFIPVYGDGPFGASLHDVHVSGKANIGTLNKALILEKLDLHAELNDFKLKVDGLLGGGSLGSEIGGMLERIGAKLAVNLAPRVAKMMSDVIRLRVNEALKKFNMGDLIG